MQPTLDPRDAQYMAECLADQDSFMYDVEIRRCKSIDPITAYPGDKPDMTRNSIYTRAEITLITLPEAKRAGGTIIYGDLRIRCDVELRGSNPSGDLDYGDKMNPDNVADIIHIDAPYQGDWYVVGVPEPGQLTSSQTPSFWNAFIRRIKTGSHGK